MGVETGGDAFEGVPAARRLGRTLRRHRRLRIGLEPLSGIGHDVMTVVEAYRLYAKQADYPTHIGITEAGKPPYAVTKSAEWLAERMLATEYGDEIDRARADFIRAQCQLAYLHERGLGVKQDLQQAIAWYEKAAAQGNDYAENSLGQIYAKVKPDQSVKFHKLAAGRSAT